MSVGTEHPSRGELASFLEGRLDWRSHDAIERHVAGCEVCCQIMADLPADTLLALLRPAETSVAPRLDPTERRTAVPAELIEHPRYRVMRVLGKGGMGTVFLAEHRIMKRQVALKVIHPDLLRNPVAIKRFQLEVRAAAQLDHPNIVRAHDAEHAGSLHFLVMEYVEGRSLAQFVRERGALAPEQACRCIRQAARGLQHAFEKGMVHRDIKPQNLMLTKQGQVKILDFGLARFAREAGGDDSLAVGVPGRPGTFATAEGSVFGTPDYIAPEQAQDSRAVDIRADIYSLGCTLHFLLTGAAPFAGLPSSEKLAAHLSRPLPPPHADEQPASPALAVLVARMTAKNPADRFATPADVCTAIDECLALDRIRPAAIDRPHPRPRRWVIGGLAVALAMVVLASAILRPRDTEQRPSVSVDGPKSPPPPARADAEVLIVMPEQFAFADYAGVRRALEERGAKVTVASTGRCVPLPGASGSHEVVPDLLLPQQATNAADHDAIVLVGGFIHRFKDEDPARDALWGIVDTALAAGKPVAAVDSAQGILAIKGDLRARRVAASDALRRLMPDYAGSFDGAPVTTDRGIITAGSAAAARELATRILDAAAR